MARTTLELLLKGKDQSASQALDQVEGRMQDVGDSSNDLSGAVQVAGAALASFATVETARAAYELAKLGAQSKRTKEAFENISGGSDEAAANLEAMEQATRGAMSEVEMMANANKLLQMGLADSSDELATVTEMATRLGSSMGMTAGQAMDDFAALLANKSLPRLDQFGIASGKVRERWNELKATMGDDEAFKLAVMEQGQAALERLGPAIEDDALAFERLEASVENLRIAFAERLTPVLADAAEGLETLLTWNENIDAAYDEQAGRVANTADSYEDYVTGVLDAQVAARQMASTMRESAQESLLAAETNVQVAQNLGVMSQEAWRAHHAMRAVQESGIASKEALISSSHAAQQAAGPMSEMAVSAEEAAVSSGQLATKLMEATDAQIANQLIGMLDPKKMGAEAYSAAVRDIGIGMGTMDAESIALAENMEVLASSIEEGIIPAEESHEALEYLIIDAEDGKVEMENFGMGIETTNTALNRLKNLDRPTKAFDDVGDAAREQTGNVSGFSSSLASTETNLRKLVSGSPYTLEVIANSTDGGGGDGGDDNDPGNIPQEMSAMGSGSTTLNVTVNAGAMASDLDIEDLAYRVSEVLGRRLNSQLRARGIA
jgi:hypothetical protein